MDSCHNIRKKTEINVDGLIKIINTLRPIQNGRHFTPDTFVNENVRISIKFSLKFVLKDPINNIPSLVQIMPWRRPGDKPLSEPVMVSLLTHICVTRPQWVKHVWSCHFYDELVLNTRVVSKQNLPCPITSKSNIDDHTIAVGYEECFFLCLALSN